MIKELTNKMTTEYLEDILSGNAHISNPARLEVPEFGGVTATSMRNFHFNDGEVDGERKYPYFSFRRIGVDVVIEYGEFYKKDGKYFVEIKEKGEHK